MYKYKKMKLKEITDNFVVDFDRTQEVNKVYFMKDGKLDTSDYSFVDDWSFDRKFEVADEFRDTIKSGGSVIVAFDGKKVIGFTTVSKEIFFDEYINMEFIHVDNKYRGKGIGKKLFHLISLEALKLGAKKLYISAQCSFETINFYLGQGCELTEKIHKGLQEKEPYDIQLQYKLDYKVIMHGLTTHFFYNKKVSATTISKAASALYRYLPEDEKDFLDVCDAFLEERKYGFFSVATLWMKRRNEIVNEKNIKRFEKMLYNHCDNWARVDQFCYRVLNPLTNKYPLMYDYLLKWSDSKNKDVRRASLVSMIISSKGQSLTYDYDKMIYLVDKLKHDEDFHVRKGCGWILKYAYVTYPFKVEKYLRENVRNLDRMIFRYALEFVHNPLREELINL